MTDTDLPDYLRLLADNPVRVFDRTVRLRQAADRITTLEALVVLADEIVDTSAVILRTDGHRASIAALDNFLAARKGA